MTDHPTPDDEVRTGSERFNLNAPRPTGRPIYESQLLPTRKRRRFSPWLVVPLLLLALGGLLYILLFAPRPRPSVSTAGMLVYASDAGSPGVSHLWIAQADGSGAHTLTSGPGADSSPTFTADGRQVAFLSNRAGGDNQIYLVDGDGKNLTQVTRTGGAKSMPAFALGSNSLLGFLSGGTLAVTDVDKGNVSLLLPAPGQSSHPDTTDPSQAQVASSTAVGFSWKPAPDASHPGLAAVLDSSGIQTLAVLPDLDSPPRLTQNDQPNGPPLAAADNISLAWAPDGSKMAVALLHVLGLPGGKKGSALLQFDPQGNAQNAVMPLLQDPAIGPQNPVFSPDGAQIAFEVWRQPDLASRVRLGLFLVPATGGLPRVLAKGDAGAAQFSADGAQVYFLARRRDGGHDLCRINTDGKGVSRLSDGHVDINSFALSPQVSHP